MDVNTKLFKITVPDEVYAKVFCNGKNYPEEVEYYNKMMEQIELLESGKQSYFIMTEGWDIAFIK